MAIILSKYWYRYWLKYWQNIGNNVIKILVNTGTLLMKMLLKILVKIVVKDRLSSYYSHMLIYVTGCRKDANSIGQNDPSDRRGVKDDKWRGWRFTVNNFKHLNICKHKHLVHVYRSENLLKVCTRFVLKNHLSATYPYVRTENS